MEKRCPLNSKSFVTFDITFDVTFDITFDIVLTLKYQDFTDFVLAIRGQSVTQGSMGFDPPRYPSRGPGL